MDLTVIIPCYNEEKVIGNTLEKVTSFLGGKYSYEVIVVNDCSKDATSDIVRRFCDDRQTVRLLENDGNMGKGFSIKRGVTEAKGEYLLYTDADLVYSIEGVVKYIDELKKGCDIAVGSRVHKESLYAMNPENFPYIYVRHLTGRLFILTMKMILKMDISDTQCGFKCFKAAAAKDIFDKMLMKDFSFDVEILRIALLKGYKIVEMPVFYLYEGAKSAVKMRRDALRMLKDLFKIKRNLRLGKYN